jgi:hypothetical protein
MIVKKAIILGLFISLSIVSAMGANLTYEDPSVCLIRQKMGHTKILHHLIMEPLIQTFIQSLSFAVCVMM